jgi:hypothetical protein
MEVAKRCASAKPEHGMRTTFPSRLVANTTIMMSPSDLRCFLLAQSSSVGGAVRLMG